MKSQVGKNAKTGKYLTIDPSIVDKSTVMAISDKLPLSSDVMSTTTAGDDRTPITMIKRFKTKSEIMEQENHNKRR